MDLQAQEDPSTTLCSIPYDRRWELLKPTIERLYIYEKRKLAEVIGTIRTQYKFHANEPQYKYQIKKWKLKKNSSATKRVASYRAIENKTSFRKASAADRERQDFDSKNVQRCLKSKSTTEISSQPAAKAQVKPVDLIVGNITQFGNRIFINGNMPPRILELAATTMNHCSLPLYDSLFTASLPQCGLLSPVPVTFTEMTTTDRAQLFVEGNFDNLLQSMDSKQINILSMWRYKFWLFSFKTAKHWGHGFHDRNADMLCTGCQCQKQTMPDFSPNILVRLDDIASKSTSKEILKGQSGSALTLAPHSLCKWSVHCDLRGFENPLVLPLEDLRSNDRAARVHWLSTPDYKNFTKKLCENIETISLSDIGPYDLPIATSYIAETARRSPKEFLKEAFGFSIISRNLSLLADLISSRQDLDITELYPYHLAASYLNGSKECCLVFDFLADIEHGKGYVNEWGHTVLDQLMMTILKSHTSCVPGMVDPALKNFNYFQGQEVDICGRWDADSDCVRSFFVIPFEWKHMFCHTSVQAICHCIGVVYGRAELADVNTPSGLFAKTCLDCGRKLQLFPLHTLVFVGVHLSQSGCRNENLFGILACLLRLLSLGANPLCKAAVSVQALLDGKDTVGCNHEELNPFDFLEKLLPYVSSSWSLDLNRGWQVIRNVLWQSVIEWEFATPQPESAIEKQKYVNDFDMFIDYSMVDTRMLGEAECRKGIPIDCPHSHEHKNFFGENRILSSLWAAVQTELLTYRRPEEGPWLSPNFSMSAADRSLTSGDKSSIGLLRDNMMKGYCACGEFSGCSISSRPAVEDVASYRYSNMNDSGRAYYIGHKWNG